MGKRGKSREKICSEFLGGNNFFRLWTTFFVAHGDHLHAISVVVEQKKDFLVYFSFTSSFPSTNSDFNRRDLWKKKLQLPLCFFTFCFHLFHIKIHSAIKSFCSFLYLFYFDNLCNMMKDLNTETSETHFAWTKAQTCRTEKVKWLDFINFGFDFAPCVLFRLRLPPLTAPLMEKEIFFWWLSFDCKTLMMSFYFHFFPACVCLSSTWFMT